jgi:hypothetical protein
MQTEAAKRYAAACADTHKAWHATPLLSRARVEQVRWVRRVLREGDSSQIATMLADLCGPMHPGDLASAAESGSTVSSKGIALALSVLDAVLPVCVEERRRSALKSANRKSGVQPMLDIDRLKGLLLHWIDHGALPLPLDERHDQPRRIAEFLRGEGLRQADEQSQAMLRMACIAVTAPAVESALVMTRLSEGYLVVMETAARPAPVPRPDPSRSAMARSEEDDEVAWRAFDVLAGSASQRSAPGGAM